MAKVIRPSYIGNYIKYLKNDSIEEINNRYNEIVGVAQINAGIMPEVEVQPMRTVQSTGENAEKVQLRIEDYEMICFEKQECPMVSIVIPVYN